MAHKQQTRYRSKNDVGASPDGTSISSHRTERSAAVTHANNTEMVTSGKADALPWLDMNVMVVRVVWVRVVRVRVVVDVRVVTVDVVVVDVTGFGRPSAT